MSQALNKAIYRRLTGLEDLSAYPAAAAAQAVIAAHLGVDADTHLPAVYEGNWQNAVQLPAITFRPGGGATDRRFQTSGQRAGDVYYDMEIWDGPDRYQHTQLRPDGTSPDGSYIEPVAEAIQKLLDVTRNIAPLMVLTAGRIEQSEIFVDLVESYNKEPEGDVYFGLLRWYFKEMRY